MAKTIIGVMGPGKSAASDVIEQTTKLGQLIAQAGWVLLTGGRNVGVMEAASKGAKQAGGITVGILPTEYESGTSKFVDIPIYTGMGSARNNINILSSDVVVACGSGAGTTSEVMLALKAQKPLILLQPPEKLVTFVDDLPYPKPVTAATAEQVIPHIQNLI